MKTINRSCGSNCKNITQCILSNLLQTELDQVTQTTETTVYKKNKEVFIQGYTPQGVFCVNHGKIKLVIVNNDGREFLVRIVGPGEIFGHRALFSDEKYKATAIALEDSVVCFYEKEFFIKMVHEHPSVAFKLIVQLSRNMGIADADKSALAHNNVRERFARLLLRLKESYGVNKTNVIHLEIKLTRDEMASMIGTSLETTVRLFTEFKNEGIIFQEQKRITIIDEKKLIEFANV